jgi:hypothetical protein
MKLRGNTKFYLICGLAACLTVIPYFNGIGQVIAGSNHGFESNFSGWHKYRNYSPNSNAKVQIDSVNAYSGFKAACYRGASSNEQLVTFISGLVKGASYNLTFYSAGTQANLHIGAPNALFSTDTVNINVNGASPNYALISVNIQADSSIMGVGFDFQRNQGPNRFPFWIDSLSISLNVLPVRLVGVNAVQTENVVVLGWKTSQESNSDKFVVERSNDARIFNAISSVKAAGNSSSVINYSISDQSPFIGDNYYRIKSIDNNGEFYYSKVVYQNYQPEHTTVRTFPNPATEFFTIESFVEVLSLRLINMNGCEVTTEVTKTDESWSCDVRDLKPGIYRVIAHLDQVEEPHLTSLLIE